MKHYLMSYREYISCPPQFLRSKCSSHMKIFPGLLVKCQQFHGILGKQFVKISSPCFFKFGEPRKNYNRNTLFTFFFTFQKTDVFKCCEILHKRLSTSRVCLVLIQCKCYTLQYWNTFNLIDLIILYGTTNFVQAFVSK